jgi:hypothetical protein
MPRHSSKVSSASLSILFSISCLGFILPHSVSYYFSVSPVSLIYFANYRVKILSSLSVFSIFYSYGKNSGSINGVKGAG